MIIGEGTRVLLIGYETYDLKSDGTKYYKGGTEVVTNQLLEYLIQKGCQVYYLITHGRITRALKNSYFDTYGCYIDKAPKNDASELTKFIEANKIELIINSTCMDSTSRYLFAECISKVSVPTLVYNHGSNCCHINSYGNSIIDNPNVHLISATQHEYEEHITFGVPKDRLHQIDNPVALPEVEIKPTDNSRFIINARMVEQKGIPNALDLCVAINKPVDLIGRDNNYKVYDQVMSYPKDILNYVGLVDRPTMIEKISGAEMLILLPNGPEGKSLVMLEAMAMGTPVITWDDYSFSTFVDPEYNILLPHTPDYIDYFKEIYLPKLDYYTDYSRRCEMSKQVIEKYGINSYYAKLDKIIEKLGGTDSEK